MQFIRKHPDLEIAGDPLRDWIRWDALVSVQKYADKMRQARGAGGGGIEMAAFSELKGCNVERLRAVLGGLQAHLALREGRFHEDRARVLSGRRALLRSELEGCSTCVYADSSTLYAQGLRAVRR